MTSLAIRFGLRRVVRRAESASRMDADFKFKRVRLLTCPKISDLKSNENHNAIPSYRIRRISALR